MMKPRITIFSILAACACMVLLFACGGTNVAGNGNPGGSGTEVIGVLVDTTGKQLHLAKVTLYRAVPADSVLDTNNYLKATSTDDKGAYTFDSVNAGTYEIRASYNNGALVGTTGTFSYSDTSKPYNAGTDTLRAPGSIHGCATLLQVPAEGIEVYIPGTSFSAHTDASGCYAMTGVAPGSYRITYVYAGYIKVHVDAQVVRSRQTTEVVSVDMEIDPGADVPVPQGVVASFDTVAQVVTLTWNPVHVSDLWGYQVWIDTSGTPGRLIEVGRPVRETSFKDTVARLLTGRLRDTVRYQVTAIDINSKQSDPSPACPVVIVSDSLIKTSFSWQVKPDTIRLGDTARIIIRYVNPTRPCTQLTWWMPQGSTWYMLRQTGLTASSGFDTLKYVPVDSGFANLKIEVTDNASISWKDSIRFSISGPLRHPNIWETMAPMSKARRQLGVANLNGLVYAVGGAIIQTNSYGQPTSVPVDSVECYDPTTNIWSHRTPMRNRRYDFGLAASGGKLYAFGGFGVKVVAGQSRAFTSDSIESYDPAANTWSRSGTLLFPRSGFAICTTATRICITGGVNYDAVQQDDTLCTSIDLFDPVAKTWTTISHLLKPRARHQTVYAKGKFYIFGGLGGSPLFTNAVPLNDMEIFDAATGQFVGSATLSGTRQDFRAELVGDSILVFGGMETTDYIQQPLSAVEAFNTSYQTWSTASKSAMPVPLESLGSTVVNGQVYCIGGSTDPGAAGLSNRVLRYTP